MSDFAFRHMSDRLGTFATSRRSKLQREEIDFITEKVAERIPFQHIANMLGRPLADVQKIAATLNVAKIAGGLTVADLAALEELEEMARGIGERKAALLREIEELRRRMDALGVGRVSYSAMKTIASEVAHRYGLTLDELRGPQRARKFSHPRQEAMFLIAATGRFSLPQIGEYFGGRDHTTVLHAKRAVEARRAEERTQDAA